MSDEDFGLSTLILVSNDTQQPFNIKYTHKRYTANRISCTVTMFGKSFTEVGENCTYKAIVNCIEYAVETFAMFADLKPALEEKRMRENKLCQPCKFEL